MPYSASANGAVLYERQSVHSWTTKPTLGTSTPLPKVYEALDEDIHVPSTYYRSKRNLETAGSLQEAVTSPQGSKILPDTVNHVQWTRKRLPDRKSKRPGFITPPMALAQYLDMEEVHEKEQFWELIKLDARASSLPIILLHYLHQSSSSKV